MESNLKYCDLSYLQKFTRSDPEKIVKYIGTYLRTSERIFKELEEAGREGDKERLYIKAHTVKPQVQYMGINRLQEVLIQIEEQSQSDAGLDSINLLVEQAIELYKQSSEELRAYFGRLNN